MCQKKRLIPSHGHFSTPSSALASSNVTFAKKPKTKKAISARFVCSIAAQDAKRLE